METLELKPITKKKLGVLIVAKEYNEPFQLTEQIANPLNTILKPSIGFYKFLETVVSKVKVDFATEELGMRSQKEFYEDNVAAEVFRKAKIPYFPVDIDENAKNYLATALDKKIELIDSVLKALDALLKQKVKG